MISENKLIENIILLYLLKEPLNKKEIEKYFSIKKQALNSILNKLIEENKIKVKKVGRSKVYWTNPLIFAEELYVARVIKSLKKKRVGEVYEALRNKGFSENKVDSALLVMLALGDIQISDIPIELSTLMPCFYSQVKSSGFPVVLDYRVAEIVSKIILKTNISEIAEKYPNIMWIEADREKGLDKGFLIVKKPWGHSCAIICEVSQ